MKKFIALAMALVMSLALVACSAPAASSGSASEPEVVASDLDAIKAKDADLAAERMQRHILNAMERALSKEGA